MAHVIWLCEIRIFLLVNRVDSKFSTERLGIVVFGQNQWNPVFCCPVVTKEVHSIRKWWLTLRSGTDCDYDAIILIPFKGSSHHCYEICPAAFKTLSYWLYYCHWCLFSQCHHDWFFFHLWLKPHYAYSRLRSSEFMIKCGVGVTAIRTLVLEQ